MGAGLGFDETETGATLDYLHLMVEVVTDHLRQVERPGNPIDQRNHVHAEALLERRVLVELIEDHLGNGLLASIRSRVEPRDGCPIHCASRRCQIGVLSSTRMRIFSITRSIET